MSNKKQETIADIVREMRKRAQEVYEGQTGYPESWEDQMNDDEIREIADRIEAAAKREREAGAEKMRENLGEVMHKKYTAQICGDIGEMVGREAACHKPVTDCHGLNAAAMREALEQIHELLGIGGKPDTSMCIRYEAAYQIAKEALSAPPRNCDVLSDKQEALAAIHEDRGYVNNPIDERRLTVEWLFDEAKGETHEQK